MKFNILFLSLIYCLSLLAETASTIVVIGEAERSITADEWQLMFDIQLKDKSREAIMQSHKKILSETERRLDKIKIDDDLLKTSNFSVSPWYEWEKDKNVFKGYQLNHSLSIRLDKFDLIDKLIAQLIDLNGITVNHLAHELKFETRAKESSKMFEDAVISAKNKIDAITRASKNKFKRFQVISEDLEIRDQPVFRMQEKANMSPQFANDSGSDGQGLSLAPLEIKLNTKLKVIAEIE